MKKRLLTLLLSLTMVFSVLTVPTVQAAETGAEPEFADAADRLYQMGVFKGMGFNADGSPDFALDQDATRLQGVIMLLRLLGEEDEALAFTGPVHFVDAPKWAERYLGYAYAKDYTRGTSLTEFGDGPLTADMFFVFLLRALNYSHPADYEYQHAAMMAEQARLIQRGEYIDHKAPITRNDCVQLCYNALLCYVSNGRGFGRDLLLDKLIAAGSIDPAKAEACGIAAAADKVRSTYDNILDGKLIRKDRDREDWYTAHTAQMEKKLAAASKVAKAAGMEDLKWIAHPKTDAEYLNDVYCCWIVGDYTLWSIPAADLDGARRFQDKTFFLPDEDQMNDDLFICHPELMGMFANVQEIGGGVWYSNGDGRLSMEFKPHKMTQTLPQLAYNQKVAVDAAWAIHDQLHAQGKITENMTQLEIAQVYYDYLRTLGVTFPGMPETEADRLKSVEEDSLYACLVTKSASCVGQTAALNALLHLEGISAQGVEGHPVGEANPNVNHVFNRVVLDGKEYFCDWLENISFRSFDEMQTIYDMTTSFSRNLELARSQD